MLPRRCPLGYALRGTSHHPLYFRGLWCFLTMIAAGMLAYMIATFNGGYVWHLVLFNDMYLALKTWSRFDDPVLPLGAAAICIQVREGQCEGAIRANSRTC